MDFTHLGRTGLRVSRLCLGTMNFGPRTSEQDAHAIMDIAHEVGINFGRFRSEVYLPIKVSPDCVDASYENGFLMIRLSKVCQP